MAKPELGSKRQCESCAAKFFDLNKDPVSCPRCGEVFHAPLASARRAAAAEPEEEDEVQVAGPEIVSLDEADDTEGGKVDPAVPDDVDVDVDVDVEDDDDAGTDDTFLEVDDEGDDVTGLIDGEIEKDDET